MLVLTRKLQEKIQIGPNVTVTILRLKGNVVQVGIDAPKDVRILRAELREFDSSERAAALSSRLPKVGPVTDPLVEEPAAAKAEPESANDERSGCDSVIDGPCVGRRFMIRQLPDRYGRSQVFAVAAP